MKRLSVLWGLLLTFLLVFSSDVLADTEYYIKEGGFTVTVPDGYYIIHKDMAENDPTLELVGMTSEEINSFLQERYTFIDVIDPDFKYEVSVVVLEDENSRKIFNLNNFTNEQILNSRGRIDEDDLSSQTSKELSQLQGIADSVDYDSDSIKVIQTPQCKFIEVKGVVHYDASDASGKINYTVVNGKSISLNLSLYDEAALNEASMLLSSMTDSMVFDEIEGSSKNQEQGSGAGVFDLKGILYKASIGAVVAAVFGGIAVLVFRWKRHKEHSQDFNRIESQETQDDSYSNLVQLKRLLDEGIITQEEFEAKREEIFKG